MSEALEQRMTAMHARLSKLSTAVDRKADQRAQERFITHRYYRDAPPTTNAAAGTSSVFNSLCERDVNSSTLLNKTMEPKPALFTNATPSSAFAPVAAAPESPRSPQVTSVDAMLQLARQHASAAGGAQLNSISSNGNLTRIPTIPPAVTKTQPPPQPSTSALDFSGLHTYSFQEKFPTPRSAAEATITSENKSISGHRYAQGKVAANARSPNASFASVSSSSVLSAAQMSEAPFDAFRVVQERLRQKMRQLTNTSPTPAQVSADTTKASAFQNVQEKAANCVPNPAAPKEIVCATRGELYLEDDSPPPRPPPGTRAETATPLRSPETPLDKEGDTTKPDTPASVRSQGSSVVQELPQKQHVQHAPTLIEAKLSGAPPALTERNEPRHPHHEVLYAPNEGDATAEAERALRRPREYMYMECIPSTTSSRASSADQSDRRHAPPPRSSSLYEGGGFQATMTQRVANGRISPASGAFSDPTSAMMRQQPPQNFHGAPKSGTAQNEKRALHAGSQRTASRSKSNSCPEKRRLAARGNVGYQQHNSKSRSSRRAVSTSPSPSHPRERSSTGPHATRSKPISLNVEATILASVSGAELFALLRMRGLIDSEGDTEEYRLPPTRCHRLYVTSDELRQLQLLRQSIHAMEEEQKDMPSYQRPTVAARSRNAEFSPPPAVTHYIDH